MTIRDSSGADPGFQVRGGGALKKIAPSGGRREHFWSISCEKSRFYAKKNHFFFNFRGARAGCPPRSAPVVRSMYNFVNCLQFNIRYETVERPAPVGGALVYINTDV